MQPTCPCCQTQMKPKVFKGYYDSFTCWTCECTEERKIIPGSTVKAGAYAFATEGEPAEPDIFRR